MDNKIVDSVDHSINLKAMLIEHANSVKSYVDFEINLAGKPLQVRLKRPNTFEMGLIQTTMQKDALKMFAEMGYDKRPINEELWQRTIEQSKGKAANPETFIEPEKPENLAEQYSKSMGFSEMVKWIAANYLYALIDGEEFLMCVDEESKRIFVKFLGDDLQLHGLILSKYTELIIGKNYVDESLAVEALKNSVPAIKRGRKKA